MISMIQILAAMLATINCSFLQTSSNQFQSALKPTFFPPSERFFIKPIFIPNITRQFERSHVAAKFRIHNETQNAKMDKTILNNDLGSVVMFGESKVNEKYSDEDSKTVANPLKFSSRYSTKGKTFGNPSEEEIFGLKGAEKRREAERENGNSSRIPETPDSLEKNENKEIPSIISDAVPVNEKHKSFSDRSDQLDDSEEEREDVFRHDAEESIEIGPTTNEPYSESLKPTPFGSYPQEEVYENYETTSSESEESDNSVEKEEKEEEEKRSVNDYYNLGSKNYHSIQTPLDEIKYRGPHSSFKGDFASGKTRTKLVNGIRRRPSHHNWPYSRAQIKSEHEKLNEISDRDESYEKILDEVVTEEVKTKPKQPDLESAIEKDEFKFDRNGKYNYVDERNRRKQQEEGLSAEEEKDDERPLFQTLKNYQMNEKESNYQPEVSTDEEVSKFKVNKGIWSTKNPLSTTSKNIFKTKTPPKRPAKNFNISNELTPDFQSHEFLGPIIFNHKFEQQKVKAVVKPFVKPQKQPVRNIFLKGLLKNEKLDQDKLTNQRIQKSVFETGNANNFIFNHLEESEELYNAILANIQSVFGLRIQPGKSGVKHKKVPAPEIKLDESKSLTWSLPVKKGQTGEIRRKR